MHWIRFEYHGQVGFGALNGDRIELLKFDESPLPALDDAVQVALAEVKVLIPVVPSKLIALWNNFHALAVEKNSTPPRTPLYLIKPPNSYLACGGTIRHPPSYKGAVFYEGELGIVIGRTASNLADIEQAQDCIYGYTCVNDVTAFDLLKEESNFDQWTRAKGFDTFGAFGPVIATDLDSEKLEVITRVDGKEVQHYPISDMILSPSEIVRQLSQNMTLNVGDVICCGTSIGLGPMPRPCSVEVEIPGIGHLKNRYE